MPGNRPCPLSASRPLVLPVRNPRTGDHVVAEPGRQATEETGFRIGASRTRRADDDTRERPGDQDQQVCRDGFDQDRLRVAHSRSEGHAAHVPAVDGNASEGCRR